MAERTKRRDHADLRQQAKAAAATCVRQLAERYPGIGAKELRKIFWETAKEKFPLRQGRPLDPHTAEGVRLYQAGKPMSEILPAVLGKPRPADPTEADIWDLAAQSLRRNIYRHAANRKAGSAAARRDHTRDGAGEARPG